MSKRSSARGGEKAVSFGLAWGFGHLDKSWFVMVVLQEL
jgi:hypothetical protein